jgi:hypothetical protein
LFILLEQFLAGVQQRTIAQEDTKLTEAYTKLTHIQDTVVKQVTGVKRTLEKGEDAEPAIKRLKKNEEKYSQLFSTLPGLQHRSSGHVAAPNLKRPQDLVDSRALTQPVPQSISSYAPMPFVRPGHLIPTQPYHPMPAQPYHLMPAQPSAIFTHHILTLNIWSILRRFNTLSIQTNTNTYLRLLFHLHFLHLANTPLIVCHPQLQQAYCHRNDR